MQGDLVEQARRGDQAAFAQLAAESVDRCYAIAFRILRDPQRAQGPDADCVVTSLPLP